MNFSPGHLLNKYVFGGEVSQTPGAVVGPPPSVANLVQNPDGSFYSPDNGQTYHKGADGSMQATAAPNVSQQVGSAASRAAGLYDQAGGYDQREQGAFDREAGLADHLNAVAHGQGPSVAGTQLAIGQEQAANQQLAQAAGASGGNAALARMNAMSNTAQLQAQTNQAAALARAQESTNALNQLAGVTGNMTNQSGGMAGQKISAANALNGLAMNGETNKEDADLEARKANAAGNTGATDKLLKGIGAAVGL